MHRLCSGAAAVAATLSGFLLPPTAGAGVTTPSFRGIGVPAGAAVHSQINGLSADGSTVVGESSGASGSSNGPRAFRWTAASGFQNLGGLPGDTEVSRHALAVSSDGGAVAGRSGPDQAPRPVRWGAGPAPALLPPADAAVPEGTAFGISGDGRYAVGRSGSAATVWDTQSGTSRVLAPGGRAVGASHDGSVVVGTAGGRALRWTQDGGPQDLGTLAAGESAAALGVSSDGSVVVGSSSGAISARRAFRWTEQTGMLPLGSLPGFPRSQAFDVSDDGSVIVGVASGSTGDRAMLWTPSTGIVDLNQHLPGLGLDLSTWTLARATGVSADGLTIAGFGFRVFPNGESRFEGWVATIPAPGSGLAALAVPALALRRRRRPRPQP